jgi:hypothetical protein
LRWLALLLALDSMGTRAEKGWAVGAVGLGVLKGTLAIRITVLVTGVGGGGMIVLGAVTIITRGTIAGLMGIRGTGA